MDHAIMHLLLAGCLAALAMIHFERPRRSLIEQSSHGSERREHPMKVSVVLILQMIIVAMRQGSSIPSVLSTVGTIIGGPSGDGLVSVSRRLLQGSSWEQAWCGVVDDDNEDAADTGRARAMYGIRQALEGSWLHGQSPVGPLAAAIDRIQTEQKSAIEQEAARLSVRLLLPTGLCFLPAFILIGVIPAIVSVMA